MIDWPASAIRAAIFLAAAGVALALAGPAQAHAGVGPDSGPDRAALGAGIVAQDAPRGAGSSRMADAGVHCAVPMCIPATLARPAALVPGPAGARRIVAAVPHVPRGRVPEREPPVPRPA